MKWHESGQRGGKRLKQCKGCLKFPVKKVQEITPQKIDMERQIFIYSFSKDLWNLYYFPGTVLGTQEAMENKKKNVAALLDL